MNTLKIFIIMLSLSIHSTHTEQYFEIKKSMISSYDTDIMLCADEGQIGFVSYKKIPLILIYVIYNLYVYSDYRHQGYGRLLLTYCCSVIQKRGGKRIYLQPGPFEMVNGELVKIEPYDKQDIQRLTAFYQKNGFQKVYKVTSECASILYRIMGIDEDARYLLTKCFE